MNSNNVLAVLVVIGMLGMMIVNVEGGKYPYETTNIGDRALSPFKSFGGHPVRASELPSISYSAVNGSFCKPGIGIAYTFKGKGPTSSHPVTLYYTPSGQLSGLGVDVFTATRSPLPRSLTSLFYIPVASSSSSSQLEYHMEVSFRSDQEACMWYS